MASVGLVGLTLKINHARKLDMWQLLKIRAWLVTHSLITKKQIISMMQATHFLGASERHIRQSALFLWIFYDLLFASCIGHQPVGVTGQMHKAPLKPLGFVDGGQGDLIAILSITGNLPEVPSLDLERLTGSGSTLNVDGNRQSAADRAIERLNGMDAQKLRQEATEEISGNN